MYLLTYLQLIFVTPVASGSVGRANIKLCPASNFVCHSQVLYLFAVIIDLIILIIFRLNCRRRFTGIHFASDF